MMIANSTLHTSAPEQEYLQYRAISTTAVVALFLGIVSFITLPTATTSIEACLFVCPLPALGLLLGIWSVVTIRRNRMELSGLPLAYAAVALSAFFLCGGLTLATYIYMTEVPENYSRITFAQMKPDDSEVERQVIVPPEIESFEGKKVFIKGYMRPPDQRYHISEFLLVRDNNECCFGSNLPDYFDQIQVEMIPPLNTDYSKRIFRMGGTLKINKKNHFPGSDQPVFTLVADYIK